MITCAVPSCKSRSSHKFQKNISFFRFPKDKQTCEKWLKACELTFHNLTQSSRVCSLHFVEEDYLLKDRLLKLENKQLNKNAIPTKNLNSNNIATDREEKATIRRRKELVADALAMYENNLYVTCSNKTADKHKKTSRVEEVEIIKEENSDDDQQLDVCDTNHEISEDDDLYSLEQTCRTCSRNIDDNQISLPIFERNLSFNISPIEVIEEIHFTNLKIKLDDGLPQQICSDCMTNLTNINSFRKECEKNQLVLTAYFHNKNKFSSTNETESNTIIKEIEYFDLTEDFRIEMYKIESGKETNNFKTEYQFDNCIEQDDDSSFIKADDFFCDIDNEKNYHQNSEELIEITSNKNKISIIQKDNSICKKDFKCSSCNDTFTTRNEMQLHRKKFHPRMNICPICNQVFTSASKLNIHVLQTHNEEKAFKCDICGNGFNNIAYFKKHKTRHIKGDFECSICLRHFEKEALYNYHIKSHDPDKKYKCKFCEKSFIVRHHLINHERVHTGQRPFLCKICGKGYKQEYQLKLHSHRHTGARPYVCKTCGKGFYHRKALASHVRRHTGIKPYQCEICGKTFSIKSGLTTHSRIHTGEKPYKCDQCDCAFIIKNYLKFHKYSKHGEPHPYSSGRKDDISNSSHSCPLCSKTFKLSTSLKIHIKTHSEERNYPCNECGISFKRAPHLKSHVDRIHLKLKPYTCQYCDRTFAQTGDRNVHMRRHNVHSGKLSNDENKSLKTGNFNEDKVSATLVAPERITQIEEYPQDINNVEVQVAIEAIESYK